MMKIEMEIVKESIEYCLNELFIMSSGQIIDYLKNRKQSFILKCEKEMLWRSKGGGRDENNKTGN